MITSNAKINIFCDSFLLNKKEVDFPKWYHFPLSSELAVFPCNRPRLVKNVIFFFKNEMKKKVRSKIVF